MNWHTELFAEYLIEMIDCAACPFGVYIGDGFSDCVKDSNETCYSALLSHFNSVINYDALVKKDMG